MSTKGGRPQNLKPPSSTEEARKRGAKGGKASAESRRKKNSMKLAMITALELRRSVDGGQVLDGYQQIALAMLGRAARGDVSAAQFLRDSIGEKPTDKVEGTCQVRIEDLIKKIKGSEF